MQDIHLNTNQYIYIVIYLFSFISYFFYFFFGGGGHKLSPFEAQAEAVAMLVHPVANAETLLIQMTCNQV